MMGVLSDEVGVRSVTTNWNTKNASRTVMLSPIFSSESDGSQNTCDTPADMIPKRLVRVVFWRKRERSHKSRLWV